MVTTGTDSPIDHLAISTHMNLRAMVTFGMTPQEALITAMSTSGTFLGDQLGRIANGFYADLAIVDGDPLVNIADAAKVTAVVTNGAYATVEDLLAPYASATATTGGAGAAAALQTQQAPQAKAAGGRNRVLPAVPKHASQRGFWWNAPEVLEAARESCCSTP